MFSFGKIKEIEKFLQKDPNLSCKLRRKQLREAILFVNDIEIPYGIITMIIDYEDLIENIHREYQKKIAPLLFKKYYPNYKLILFKGLNHISSSIFILSTSLHIYKWLNNLTKNNNNINNIKYNSDDINSNIAIHNDNNFPKFLKLYPIPTSFKRTTNNMVNNLYPSIYKILPLCLIWIGYEYCLNILYFNTNKTIQKISFYLEPPIPSKNNNKIKFKPMHRLYLKWTKFFYSNNFGLNKQKYIHYYHRMSYYGNSSNMSLMYMNERQYNILDSTEKDKLKETQDNRRFSWINKVSKKKFKYVNRKRPDPDWKYFFVSI